MKKLIITIVAFLLSSCGHDTVSNVYIPVHDTTSVVDTVYRELTSRIFVGTYVADKCSLIVWSGGDSAEIWYDFFKTKGGVEVKRSVYNDHDHYIINTVYFDFYLSKIDNQYRLKWESDAIWKILVRK